MRQQVAGQGSAALGAHGQRRLGAASGRTSSQSAASEQDSGGAQGAAGAGGIPPLHSILASIHSRADLHRLLAQYPGLLSARDPLRQRTLLHLAACGGKADVVGWLLEAGAQQQPNAGGHLPLHEAAATGKPGCVRLLVGHEPASVRAADNDGATPLHYAAACGSTQCLPLLLKAGAEVDAYDSKGHTPLHLAVTNQRIPCAGVLLAARSNPLAPASGSRQCSVLELAGGQASRAGAGDEAAQILSLVQNAADQRDAEAAARQTKLLAEEEAQAARQRARAQRAQEVKQQQGKGGRQAAQQETKGVAQQGAGSKQQAAGEAASAPEQQAGNRASALTAEAGQEQQAEKAVGPAQSEEERAREPHQPENGQKERGQEEQPKHIAAELGQQGSSSSTGGTKQRQGSLDLAAELAAAERLELVPDGELDLSGLALEDVVPVPTPSPARQAGPAAASTGSAGSSGSAGSLAALTAPISGLARRQHSGSTGGQPVGRSTGIRAVAAATPGGPLLPPRFVSWTGGWVCRCGQQHLLADGCPCGARSPCRDFFWDECDWGQACRWPHLLFDLQTPQPSKTHCGGLRLGVPREQYSFKRWLSQQQQQQQQQARPQRNMPSRAQAHSQQQQAGSRAATPGTGSAPQQAQQERTWQPADQSRSAPAAAAEVRTSPLVRPPTNRVGQQQRDLEGVGEDELAALLGALGVAAAELDAGWGTAAAGTTLAAAGVPRAPAAGGGSLGLAGLRNEAGEYNCFLNVIIQCLWRCADFRQQSQAAELASQLESRDLELEAARAEAAAAAEAAAEARSGQADAEAEAAAAVKKAAEQQERASALESEVQAAQAAEAAANQQLALAQQRGAQLEVELEQMRQTNEQEAAMAQSRHGELEGQVARLQVQLQEAEAGAAGAASTSVAADLRRAQPQRHTEAVLAQREAPKATGRPPLVPLQQQGPARPYPPERRTQTTRKRQTAGANDGSNGEHPAVPAPVTAPTAAKRRRPQASSFGAATGTPNGAAGHAAAGRASAAGGTVEASGAAGCGACSGAAERASGAAEPASAAAGAGDSAANGVDGNAAAVSTGTIVVQLAVAAGATLWTTLLATFAA
ncbi:hypothetical protein ABPG75_010780 [Micractinium tetrahymenae]